MDTPGAKRSPEPAIRRSIRPWLRMGLAGAALLGAGMVLRAEGPAASAPAAPLPVGDARWSDLFRPFRTDAASLSPDGNYLAYSVREGETLSVLIVQAEHPEHATAKIDVGTAGLSTAMLTEQRERTPVRIQWMGWATDKRLLIETNQVHLVPVVDDNGKPKSWDRPLNENTEAWHTLRGLILGVDADGGHAQVLVTPMDVADQSVPPYVPKVVPGSGVTRPDEPSEARKTRPAKDEDDTEPEIVASRWRSARPPGILDYSGKHPGGVLVSAADRRGYELYLLEAEKGELTQLSQEYYDPDLRPWIDRQGRERIVLRASIKTPFPHEFDLEDHGLLKRWVPLDTKLRAATGGGFSVSPENYFGRRSIPLGFDENPDVLYYASNLGRETFGVYSVNLKTGTKLPQALEHPKLDLIELDPVGGARAGTLLYDRHKRSLAGVAYQEGVSTTLWVRPEFQALQRQLEQKFSGSSVSILEWDRAERRYLLLVRGPTDAGTFLILDTKAGTLTEFARRAPWLEGAAASQCLAYSFESARGHRLAGTLILPRAVRLKPVPVLVYFGGEPWRRAPAEYQPEAEAFAALGLAVLQVDGRGTWGFGVSQREWPKEGLDRAKLEDVVEVLDALAAKLPLSTKRVALAARGRSAYLALRAAQLAPDRFRCVLGIEPTVDIANWVTDSTYKTAEVGPRLLREYWGGRENLRKSSIFEHDEPLSRPVLLLTYPGPRGGERTRDYLDCRALERRLASTATPVVLKELDEDYVQGLPGARAAVFRDIEAFINLHLYDYTVKVGETKPVKD